MIAQTYQKQDYSGGLNSTASLRQIAPNEATRLENWDITYQGQLRQRLGLLPIGNSIPSPISGLGAFIRDAGVDLLRSYAGVIEYLNGSLWSALDNASTTAGNMLWFENVQSLGRIYVCNGDNVLRYWDRASTTLNSALTTPAGTNPHGNVMVWFENFMFHLNKVKVGSTVYTEDLFWSALGDPNTYDTVNNHTTVPGDGQLITAVPLGSELVLFKERSIQHLSGFGNASWQITGSVSSYASLSEEVGCIAPRGAVQVGDEVWFIDNQARIRRVYKTEQDAFRHDIISTKIQATLDGINKPQLAKAIAYIWNNKVFFEVPYGTDTVNTLTFVFDILASRRNTQMYGAAAEAWTTYTGWSHSCAITYPTNATIDLYFGDAKTGWIYKHGGTDDNGQTIISIFEDGNFDFGLPDQYKNYKFGRTSALSGSGNASVLIDTSIDTLPYVNIGQLLLAVTGSKVGPSGNATCGPSGNAICGGASSNELRYTYDVNGQYPLGKRIRHRIRNVSPGQPTVNSFTSSYKPRALR